MKIELYPEMNAQIVDLMRIGENPIKLYAAAYIEHLRAELDAANKRAEAAERDLVSVLKLVPISICRKHCKRASQNCTGWGDCAPEWRGPDAQKEGQNA